MTDSDATQVIAPGGLPVDATRQMTAAPGQRTEMGGSQTCPLCQAVSPATEAYCSDCGLLLERAPAGLERPEEESAPARLKDDATGRIYNLHEGENVVGRQGADILTQEATVSRRHACIRVAAGRVTIEDLGSSNGTRINERKLLPGEPAEAAPGDRIRFGQWILSFHSAEGGTAPIDTGTSSGPVAAVPDTATLMTMADEEPLILAEESCELAPDGPGAQTDPAVIGWLRAESGPGGDLALLDGETSIGRRDGNTHVVSGDPFISGRHVVLSVEGEHLFVADNGSTNGTLLNDQPLAPHVRTPLAPGDRIKIGQTVYRCESEEEPDTISRIDW